MLGAGGAPAGLPLGIGFWAIVMEAAAPQAPRVVVQQAPAAVLVVHHGGPCNTLLDEAVRGQKPANHRLAAVVVTARGAE